MTIGVKARFVGAPLSSGRCATYMGETIMERLEITLSGPVINVPLYRHSKFMVYDIRPGKDPVGDETRREFGERLRRVAHEATRGIEQEILKSLREQGHLV